MLVVTNYERQSHEVFIQCSPTIQVFPLVKPVVKESPCLSNPANIYIQMSNLVLKAKVYPNFSPSAAPFCCVLSFRFFVISTVCPFKTCVLCAGAAGPVWEQHPHRSHHQAGQLLAEAAHQPRQPEVQIRGE
jgi:hypothetical protein